MKHLALTIGPIYRTFDQAKRTRAVWAASYFFSWFIKKLTDKTFDAGFDILLPYSKDGQGNKNIYQSQYGSGLYNDRIYFFPNGKTKQELENVVNLVIKDISEDMADKTNGYDFLKEYLSIHIIELEIAGDNVLKILNDALDKKELTQRYAFDTETNHLLNYLDTKLKTGGVLIDDAFDNKGRKAKEEAEVKRFRSIPEIAASDLERRFQGEFKQVVDAGFKNEDLEFFDGYKYIESGRKIHIDGLIDKLNEKVRPYHKYYAVMYADGNNIGELLTACKENVDLQKFSKLLLDFGREAEKIIHEYGGSGIFLGGEDILAFLPIACINEARPETQNLFNLVQQLDDSFAKTIGAYAKEKKADEPTLRFGFMLSYFKHPLKESMKISHDLMEEAAKKTVCKNSIGFRLQKHSGQYMQCCIEKSKICSWNKIVEITTVYTKNVSKKNVNEKNEELLSGVIHRFKDDTFWEIFRAGARAGRLEPLFSNFFNESDHAPKDKQDFLKEVKDFAEKVFNDYPDDQDCRDIIFTVLRYIHFINSERE